MNPPQDQRLTACYRNAHAPANDGHTHDQRRLELKLYGKRSHEPVPRSLSISNGVVAKYVSLATATGLISWEALGADDAIYWTFPPSPQAVERMREPLEECAQ